MNTNREQTNKRCTGEIWSRQKPFLQKLRFVHILPRLIRHPEGDEDENKISFALDDLFFSGSFEVEKYRENESTKTVHTGCEPVTLKSLQKKRAANRTKKLQFKGAVVLSSTANSNLGSDDTGTGCAVREEQKQVFYRNQDSVPNYS